VRSRLPIDFPLSSFDLDLEAIRAEVEKVTAVRSATVHIRAGVLSIDVSERVPLVVWRSQDGLALLDETGIETARIEARDDRSDLPLIVGTNARDAVPEALALFAAADPIRDRIRGLQRVGARRWDVVLDRDQRIMLPETDPVTVFEKVIALDAAQDLLSRDVARIDFRNPRRPVLRLTATAIDSMYNSQLTQTKDFAQ
jgi:cell division protein FtsQ